ncbi:hypothetical protein ACFXA3_02425 [Streptomyces sp. NPDC059456]|uniref:hypothetical protein n=1 Tax=Streptomyces sp. NPDC059456 TaxID=3346838 RepID=UPI0036B0D344
MPQNIPACKSRPITTTPPRLPDLRDWLPEDHLAWFAIEATGQLQLAPFQGAYRSAEHGRTAHEVPPKRRPFAVYFAVEARRTAAAAACAVAVGDPVGGSWVHSPDPAGSIIGAVLGGGHRGGDDRAVVAQRDVAATGTTTAC